MVAMVGNVVVGAKAYDLGAGDEGDEGDEGDIGSDPVDGRYEGGSAKGATTVRTARLMRSRGLRLAILLQELILRSHHNAAITFGGYVQGSSTSPFGPMVFWPQ